MNHIKRLGFDLVVYPVAFTIGYVQGQIAHRVLHALADTHAALGVQVDVLRRRIIARRLRAHYGIAPSRR